MKHPKTMGAPAKKVKPGAVGGAIAIKGPVSSVVGSLRPPKGALTSIVSDRGSFKLK